MSGMEHVGVEIQCGIPIPKKRGIPKPCSPQVLALKAMKVGESIIYPGKQGEAPHRTQKRASSRCVFLKPKRFATRTVQENGRYVVRVWRVA